MRALLRTSILSLLLAGCAANTVTSLKTGELPSLPPERQWPSAENDVLNERANGMGLVNMPEMQAYLTGLLAKVKEASGTSSWPGSVYVMASSSLDAHSTAAGNVYISLGWLASAESEDEIAAILSHEWGHVYLDYQQVEKVSQGSDTLAGLASMGLSLAQSVGLKQGGLVSADNLMTSYKYGKGLVMPAWSRKQEENADRFGATVSNKLNYSFARGFKAFLERQATWEAQSAEREAADAKRLAATDSAFANWWKSATVNHPKTEDRLALLTDEMEPVLKGRRPPSHVEPWTQAQAQPRTAAVLQNYQAAIDAQTALQAQKTADALKLGTQAASGPTSQQALPVMALSLAQAGQSNVTIKAMSAQTLERNLLSPADRSWRIYAMRANDLLGAGKQDDARKLLDQGFGYFRQAPLAWPEAIRLYGQLDGSAKAKVMAQDCASAYPSYADQCRQASLSPAEQAEAAKKADAPKSLLGTIMPGFKF